jgi:hypothetical protein
LPGIVFVTNHRIIPSTYLGGDMGSDPIYWGILLCALAGGVWLGWVWQKYTKQAARRQWPRRWNLNARPLFSVHERALYRDLRAALPHHVVLAKVSMLRFCQSSDASDAKAWYERLQALHVSLVVCTPHGLVVSVIDIDNNPGSKSGQRAQKLKEAVLEACRIRYLRCLPGQWPQANLLASWAIGHTGVLQAEHAHGHDPLFDAGDQLARKLKQRRAERAARWAESSFSQDSFFASDSRFDGPSTTPSGLEDATHEEGGMDDGHGHHADQPASRRA